MKYRYLGNSGFKVSELIYGNWLTHATQIENEAAYATVHAALEGGITTFDTADVYANQAAEVVLGEALKGQRREGLEILTKIYWPVAERKPNDTGLSRKHIMESINGSLKRLQTDYVDLYQAHRYDVETPLEETMQAFADIVRQGKALYIGVSEWDAEQIRAGHKLSKELGFQLISSQPQYSMLWRVIEAEVIPTCEELGISQIVWSPMAQGVLTGKYLKGEEGRTPANSARRSEKSTAIAQAVVDVAAELGTLPGAVALAWLRQKWVNIIPLIGAKSAAQIKESLTCLEVHLSEEQFKKLDEVSKIDLGFPHDFLNSPTVNDVLYGGIKDKIINTHGL
jgi:aryl-alcohol dehydrogenase-like predicted oxidoreductase